MDEVQNAAPAAEAAPAVENPVAVDRAYCVAIVAKQRQLKLSDAEKVVEGFSEKIRATIVDHGRRGCVDTIQALLAELLDGVKPAPAAEPAEEAAPAPKKGKGKKGETEPAPEAEAAA